MTLDPEPISVWDVITKPETRPILEHRLRTEALTLEFESVNGMLALDGSQGGIVGELATGEQVFIKRSDRTVHNVPLGAEGHEWVRNEAAGYEVACILGYEDIVLPTILRTARLEDGQGEIEVAVRLYLEPSPDGELDEGAPLSTVDYDQLARAAIFDWVVEQSDRRVIDGQHGGNWYVLQEPDHEARLLLFDHQQCFGSKDGAVLASAIWDFAGHKIGPHLDGLQALFTDASRTRLLRYLTEDRLDQLLKRARKLLPYESSQQG